MVSNDPGLLLSTTVHARCGYPTEVYSVEYDRLLIHQHTEGAEVLDVVLLDRNAQHALYLLLKNRFED